MKILSSLLVLGTMIPVAFSIIGSNVCTYSPTALCNNRNLIEKCDLSSLNCVNYLRPSNESCEICNFAVEEAIGELSSEGASEFLENEFDKLCIFMEPGEPEACSVVVNTTVKFAIEWFKDNLNNDTCFELGLC